MSSSLNKAYKRRDDEVQKKADTRNFDGSGPWSTFVPSLDFGSCPVCGLTEDEQIFHYNCLCVLSSTISLLDKKHGVYTCCRIGGTNTVRKTALENKTIQVKYLNSQQKEAVFDFTIGERKYKQKRSDVETGRIVVGLQELAVELWNEYTNLPSFTDARKLKLVSVSTERCISLRGRFNSRLKYANSAIAVMNQERFGLILDEASSFRRVPNLLFQYDTDRKLSAEEIEKIVKPEETKVKEIKIETVKSEESEDERKRKDKLREEEEEAKRKQAEKTERRKTCSLAELTRRVIKRVGDFIQIGENDKFWFSRFLQECLRLRVVSERAERKFDESVLQVSTLDQIANIHNYEFLTKTLNYIKQSMDNVRSGKVDKNGQLEKIVDTALFSPERVALGDHRLTDVKGATIQRRNFEKLLEIQVDLTPREQTIANWVLGLGQQMPTVHHYTALYLWKRLVLAMSNPSELASIFKIWCVLVIQFSKRIEHKEDVEIVKIMGKRKIKKEVEEEGEVDLYGKGYSKEEAEDSDEDYILEEDDDSEDDVEENASGDDEVANAKPTKPVRAKRAKTESVKAERPVDSNSKRNRDGEVKKESPKKAKSKSRKKGSEETEKKKPRGRKKEETEEEKQEQEDEREEKAEDALFSEQEAKKTKALLKEFTALREKLADTESSKTKSKMVAGLLAETQNIDAVTNRSIEHGRFRMKRLEEWIDKHPIDKQRQDMKNEDKRIPLLPERTIEEIKTETEEEREARLKQREKRLQIIQEVENAQLLSMARTITIDEPLCAEAARCEKDEPGFYTMHNMTKELEVYTVPAKDVEIVKIRFTQMDKETKLSDEEARMALQDQVRMQASDRLAFVKYWEKYKTATEFLQKVITDVKVNSIIQPESVRFRIEELEHNFKAYTPDFETDLEILLKQAELEANAADEYFALNDEHRSIIVSGKVGIAIGAFYSFTEDVLLPVAEDMLCNELSASHNGKDYESIAEKIKTITLTYADKPTGLSILSIVMDKKKTKDQMKKEIELLTEKPVDWSDVMRQCFGRLMQQCSDLQNSWKMTELLFYNLQNHKVNPKEVCDKWRKASINDFLQMVKREIPGTTNTSLNNGSNPKAKVKYKGVGGELKLVLEDFDVDRIALVKGEEFKKEFDKIDEKLNLKWLADLLGLLQPTKVAGEDYVSQLNLQRRKALSKSDVFLKILTQPIKFAYMITSGLYTMTRNFEEWIVSDQPVVRKCVAVVFNNVWEINSAEYLRYYNTFWNSFGARQCSITAKEETDIFNSTNTDLLPAIYEKYFVPRDSRPIDHPSFLSAMDQTAFGDSKVLAKFIEEKNYKAIYYSFPRFRNSTEEKKASLFFELKYELGAPYIQACLLKTVPNPPALGRRHFVITEEKKQEGKRKEGKKKDENKAKGPHGVNVLLNQEELVHFFRSRFIDDTRNLCKTLNELCLRLFKKELRDRPKEIDKFMKNSLPPIVIVAK